MNQNDVNDLLQKPEPNDALTRRAFRIIEQWLEWARLHCQLEHAEDLVEESRALISERTR